MFEDINVVRGASRTSQKDIYYMGWKVLLAAEGIWKEKKNMETEEFHPYEKWKRDRMGAMIVIIHILVLNKLLESRKLRNSDNC